MVKHKCSIARISISNLASAAAEVCAAEVCAAAEEDANLAPPAHDIQEH